MVLQPAYRAERVIPIFQMRWLRPKEMNGRVIAEVGFRLVLQLQRQEDKMVPSMELAWRGAHCLSPNPAVYRLVRSH